MLAHVPAANREFDILALWYFLLELVANNRFVATNSKAVAAVKDFKAQLAGASSDAGSEFFSFFVPKRHAFVVSTSMKHLYSALSADINSPGEGGNPNPLPCC